MLGAVVIIERDFELVGKSIDYRGANAKASKRARPRHKCNLSNIVPGGVVLK